MYRKLVMTISVIAVLLATGCTTIMYSTDSDYVGASIEGVKNRQQVKKTSWNKNDLVKTYDDEFFYDEDGDIIKHVQTCYFENEKKFNEYTVEYQKINGRILPKSSALNGVVYLEVEYDLLPVENEGAIEDYTSMPVFYRAIQTFVFRPSYDKWTISMGNFDMPFRVDGKFVESESKFSYYRGFNNDSVLTSGWDNILLKRFHYSRDKLAEGYKKTMSSASVSLMGYNNIKQSDTTFEFEWDVIADKLIQKNIHVVETMNDLTMDFLVKREFDESARLTDEVWTVTDNKQKNPEPIVLYNQKFAY